MPITWIATLTHEESAAIGVNIAGGLSANVGERSSVAETYLRKDERKPLYVEFPDYSWESVENPHLEDLTFNVTGDSGGTWFIDSGGGRIVCEVPFGTFTCVHWIAHEDGIIASVSIDSGLLNARVEQRTGAELDFFILRPLEVLTGQLDSSEASLDTGNLTAWVKQTTYTEATLVGLPIEAEMYEYSYAIASLYADHGLTVRDVQYRNVRNQNSIQDAVWGLPMLGVNKRQG